jgi:hypothetical protein
MKVFRFDADASRLINQHGSVNLTMVRILRSEGAIQIAYMYLGPNGIVGYHQAVTAQLFLVVQGAGWVTGADRVKHPIQAHQAAFWEAGEWHEAGTDEGMVVIVIEGDGVNPKAFVL